MELRESQASSYTSRDTPTSPACRCPSGICSTRWGVRGPRRRPRVGLREPTGTHRWRRSPTCRRERAAGCTWAATRWRSSTCRAPCTPSRTAVLTRRASLSEGSVDAARCSLTCPWHEGVFLARDGSGPGRSAVAPGRRLPGEARRGYGARRSPLLPAPLLPRRASRRLPRTPDDSRFLKACRCEPTDATPVWFMRQAGRYLPEYRTLRQKHSLLELCHNPELAARVTLQPVERWAWTRPSCFADILLPFEPLGLGLSFAAGKGRRSPGRSGRRARCSSCRGGSRDGSGVRDGGRPCRAQALPPHVPLIGFAGAPFTLASYAIEGGATAPHADEALHVHRAARLARADAAVR